MKTSVRLDKYLADMGFGTRSQVKEKIRQGLVTVNGATVQKGDVKVDTQADQVQYEGQPVGYVHFEYYMLNKPAGVICATSDRSQTTVIDLISDKKRKDLFPAGRLDKDTEGLVMITNDGALSHRLLSPKNHVAKIYYAKIAGLVTQKDIQDFADGLYVDEEFRAQPARLVTLQRFQKEEESEILVEIFEGKFHQIKRMFEAVGKSVLYLKRLTFGSLSLDGFLAPGAFRALTDRELNALMAPENKKVWGRDILEDIRAVIFDLDGTLIDSMWVWRDIDIEYLKGFGLDMPDDLQENIAGISVTQTAVYFKERFHIPDSIEKIIGDWDRMALEKYTTQVPLKPGALEFLKYLKSRGIPCAIATSNSRRLTQAVLEAHNITGYFQVILTGEDIHKGKPEPDVYLETAGKLKIEPGHCLVFEDIPYGVMAANRAGMTCAAIDDPDSRWQEEDKRRLARYYIQDYFDIMFQTYEELK